MTPTQLDRAKILRDALREIPKFKKLCAMDRPWGSYQSSGLKIQVDAIEESYVTSIYVDKNVGVKILAYAEKVIREELKALGVKPPKRRGKAWVKSRSGLRRRVRKT